MGFFARLFGTGEPAKPSPEISKAQSSENVEAMMQRLKREAAMATMVHKILADYCAVLETLNELRDGKVIGLYPESKLPYPKEVIYAAFAYAYEQVERSGGQQWDGVPKNVLETTEMLLDIHFAPDQEVPWDPIENFLAFNRRLRERSPETSTMVRQLMKANPERWDRLLEIAGVSKDIREIVIR